MRRLADGAHVILAAQPGPAPILPVRSPEVLAALRVGEQVYLADGAIELRVSRAAPDKAECEVVAGGVARSGSGIKFLIRSSPP